MMGDNDELAIGLKKEKSSFSLIWVAPIVAILITAGMIWKNYVNAGTRIVIVIENGDGIRGGKTPIMYKGVKIGVVEEIHLKDDDVSKLELTALIDKRAAEGITREGNKFWKVEPKISITEVSGLDTIVRGIYISVMPAVNNKEELLALPFQDHFTALPYPPVDVFDPGLLVIVNTVEKGDIAIGAPVLYNKQAIGKVEDKKLSDDKKSIDLYLRIKTRYMDLVYEESAFFVASAVDIKASLSGISVEMGSFASFIAGGITMFNSDECFSSAKAVDKTRYHLYKNKDEIMLSDDDIVLITQDHNILNPDITKLFYKGVEAGIVKKLDYDPNTHKTKVTIKVHKDFRKFANHEAYFWIVKPQVNFDHIGGLDTIIKGSYINFVSSDPNAKAESSFVLHDKRPMKEGVHLSVITDDIKSLKEGAGLFYHGVEIGSVATYRINKDKRSFTVDLIVEPRYKDLLNASSLFYHMSGVDVKADFDGLDVRTGSLESILRGGIGVQTPDFNADKSLHNRYRLYENYTQLREYEYLNKDGLHITLLADKLGSLKKGSPIYFKQIKVGKILSYRWDTQAQKIIFKAFIVDEYAKEVHNNTLFYNASGIDAKFDLSGFEINSESIESVLSGGIAFYTPASQTSNVARNNERFELHSTKSKAMNKYMDITLFSEASYGLTVGNLVKYKSVIIGNVQKVRIVKEGVELDLKIDSKYAYLMKEDTLFWTESFEMSLQGVQNFSAALKGTSIALEAGASNVEKTYFNLMKDAPSPHLNEEGLRVVVHAQRLGGIKKDTPVYYRQVKIGSVTQYRLSDDATGVDVELFIEPCYSHLIRGNSYFYNASGIGMEVSLLSAKIRTETLESVMTGGIAVLTPDNYTFQAKDGQLFKLNDDFDKSALSWAPKLYSTDEMCQ